MDGKGSRVSQRRGQPGSWHPSKVAEFVGQPEKKAGFLFLRKMVGIILFSLPGRPL